MMRHVLFGAVGCVALVSDELAYTSLADSAREKVDENDLLVCRPGRPLRRRCARRSNVRHCCKFAQVSE